MPKNYDKCLKDVRKKIKQGKLPKYYKSGSKRLKTDEYKICSALRFNHKHWGKPNWGDSKGD